MPKSQNKMKSYLLLLFLVVILFNSCMNKPKNSTAENNKALNDSIEIIRQPYENSPEVIEYEIPVVKNTRVRHGIQKRYYKHGSLYSTIPYIQGKREGTAFTFYPAITGIKPAVWKEQPYVNNKLDGICRRYHKNGILQAEYEYKNGIPAIGMKEFSESGKPIKLPSLILTQSQTAAGYYISARLSNNSEKVDYFIGSLVEGKYLPKDLKGLQVKKGLGEIIVSSTTKSVTITAVYTTRYRNKCIISKTIKI